MPRIHLHAPQRHLRQNRLRVQTPRHSRTRWLHVHQNCLWHVLSATHRSHCQRPAQEMAQQTWLQTKQTRPGPVDA
ncbi:hypothetical protein ACHAW6_002034 [Cyclotella cf. meneghiniana]